MSPHEKLTKEIKARMTPEELELFQNFVKRETNMEIADYVRWLCKRARQEKLTPLSRPWNGADTGSKTS